MPEDPASRSRRLALATLARSAAISPLVAAFPPLAVAQALPATPSCGANTSTTVPQTEGPFYKRATPQRSSLVDSGMAGERLMLSGFVTTTQCRPLPGTVLDFWQADAAGRYDNEGYRLRGHVVADAQGRFQIETIVPGGYPGRTRHIHVKVQAPGGRVLTTQLYFPGEPLNQRDSIFSPALLLSLQRDGKLAQGSYHFVLPAA
jgi:protocatechuate 3,4-dioxygenase beta subunit